MIDRISQIVIRNFAVISPAKAGETAVFAVLGKNFQKKMFFFAEIRLQFSKMDVFYVTVDSDDIAVDKRIRHGAGE